MVDRERLGVEEIKSLYAKEQWVKSKDNPVTSWCTGSWTWRKMKDNEVGYEKLLVAWSDKGCGKICGWLWYVPENEKLNRDTTSKTEVEQSTGEAINTSDSRLDY